MSSVRSRGRSHQMLGYQWPLSARHDWPVMGGMAIILVSIGAALVGDYFIPYEPNAQNLAGTGLSPSFEHLAGTDQLGRDVFSRVIVGTRSAFIGPLFVAFGAVVIGGVVGIVAGYRGGFLDNALMRMVDVFYAVPPLLVALVVVGVSGGGYVTAVVILIAFFAPYDARLVRGSVLAVRGQAWVESVQLLGVPERRIMFREILPNVLPVALAQAMTNFAYGLVALAGLSFLGVGVPPGQADWGRMLFENQGTVFTNPWSVIAPGLSLLLLATSVNLVGDWLYEQMEGRGRGR